MLLLPVAVAHGAGRDLQVINYTRIPLKSGRVRVFEHSYIAFDLRSKGHVFVGGEMGSDGIFEPMPDRFKHYLGV